MPREIRFDEIPLAELTRACAALPSTAAPSAPVPAPDALARWLTAAGGATTRRVFLLRDREAPVGMACWEEASSIAEGRVATLPLLHLEPPRRWRAALAAAAAEARAGDCTALEVYREPPATPALVAALRRAGFQRRDAAFFLRDLRSLAARLERLRHPVLPAGWNLRPPAPDEIPALLDMLVAFGREDGSETDREALARHLAGLPAGAGPYLVLTVHGEVGATVALEVCQGLDGLRQGIITEFFVAPEHRGQGAGALLFAEVLRQLAARGAAVACGWVEGRNARARRFWSARTVEQPIESWALRL